MNQRFMKHCLSFVSICFMALLFLIMPAEVNGEEEKPDNGIGEVTIRATLKSGKSRDFTLKVVEGSTPDPEKIIAPDTVEMKTGENKALVVATEPEFAKIDIADFSVDDCITLMFKGMDWLGGPKGNCLVYSKNEELNVMPPAVFDDFLERKFIESVLAC